MKESPFFFRWLKGKAPLFGAFLLFSAILIGSFALYHLPLRAVIYPLFLCLLTGCILLIPDYLKKRSLHQTLRRMEGFTSEMLESLPEALSSEGEDYQAIVRGLTREAASFRASEDAKYKDMVEYYTLWAHQIKTPIASMKLSLESEDSAFSRSLSRDLFRIEQYVGMVLTFLRLDAGSGDYVFREYDADEIVRGAVRKYAPDFIAKKLKLTYEELDFRAVTDEKWLSFIVEQVIGNALKYTRTGGIRIFSPEKKVIAIEDTGIGIAPEDLPRVFEKGFTGKNGRVEKSASGIGLYLCRRVADKLGAKMRITSSPGEGTTVFIDLGEAETIRE